MDNEVKIGKYTLESLTTGMYTDPKIIYREYIQNSVDALEEAVNMGYLTVSDIRINIVINQENNNITIHDNGTGIKARQAFNKLTDIGNSPKKHTNNRGFRGIGRLGGLSYCERLTFITSYKGENKKSTVSFDCLRLRELLVPGEHDEYDLQRVLNEVTTYKVEHERMNDHYFIVEMEGIDSFSDLLDIERIESYIKQVAPLPYHKKFSWSTDIKELIAKSRLKIEEFPIYIGSDEDSLYQVYKSNKSKFIADMTKKLNDEISGIRVFEITDDSNNIIAIGWYAECSWYGGIVDREISGLRIRKGNILIGDSKTLGSIFKEDRFNSWTQGEVFVVSNKLIPNARRDDFEQNQTYYYFMEQLSEGIGTEISKKIREASKQRNNPFDKKINEVKKVIYNVSDINREGFNSELEKSKVQEDLKNNLGAITNLRATTQEEQKIKEETVKEIEKVLRDTARNKNYKISQISNIGKKELEVLKVVSNVLTKNLTKECVDMLLEEIIDELNR